MNIFDLRNVIEKDSNTIPYFINVCSETDRFRYNCISHIFRQLSNCIYSSFIDIEELIQVDDYIKSCIEELELSCEVDRKTMLLAWSYIIGNYEYYIVLAEENELFESAANLQKIKCLYNGE